MNAAPETHEIVEILGFLRRLADLISTGANADNLLRAADLLETYVNAAMETNKLLWIERIQSSSNLESLELRCSGLEKQVTDLSASLENERLLLDEAIVAATNERDRLSRRAEQAEAQLPTLQTDIQALVQISRLAEGQFKSLADSFRRSGDIVSQVMCEASASALDRLLEATAAQATANPKQPRDPDLPRE